jgi:hypothetical protein
MLLRQSRRYCTSFVVNGEGIIMDGILPDIWVLEAVSPAEMVLSHCIDASRN